MGKSTGPYLSLSVDTAGTGIVSQAGSVTLLRTAEKSGLTAALSAALAPWRKPLATHDPGKIVLDLAVAVALGGDCLADIALLREQPAVFGRVASDPTVSRLISAWPPTRARRWPRSIAPGLGRAGRPGRMPGSRPLTTASTPSIRWSSTLTRRW